MATDINQIFEEVGKLKPEHDQLTCLEKEMGPEIYAKFFYEITRKNIDFNVAKEYWSEIFLHRDEMTSALQRDVGLRVALCDYLINVRPLLTNPIIVDSSVFAAQERCALIDELTGLYNRRYFNNILNQELAYSSRFKEPFALLMVDIDDFKTYNDTFGHLAGDRVLMEISSVLCGCARDIDHIMRFGGEEFALILPRVSKEGATLAAERHRENVAKYEFPNSALLPKGSLTISIGVSAFPSDGSESLQLLKRADQALYKAKKQGKNCVCTWGEDNRQYPRYERSLHVVLTDTINPLVQTLGKSKDVSLGGAKIASSKPFIIGRQLDISIFDQSNGFYFQLKGSPVWIQKDENGDNKYYLGLSFTLSSQQDQQNLERLLHGFNSNIGSKLGGQGA